MPSTTTPTFKARLGMTAAGFAALLFLTACGGPSGEEKFMALCVEKMMNRGVLKAVNKKPLREKVCGCIAKGIKTSTKLSDGDKGFILGGTSKPTSKKTELAKPYRAVILRCVRENKG